MSEGTHNVFDDDQAEPPPLPDELPPVEFDEEPEHVPGSFLSALPQFFVFPAILVASLTAIYLLLRVLAGGTPDDAHELLADFRAAGPHGRWQVLHGLAEGLRQGRIDLTDVPSEELAHLYETHGMVEGGGPEQSRMRQYLLQILAYKRDPALTRYAVEALQDPDPTVRRWAFDALGRIADPATAELMEAYVAGEDGEERLLALGVLANLDTPRARDLVEQQFLADDTIVARNAVLLSARAGNDGSRPFLLRMLDRESYQGDGLLTQGLESLDEASREAARQQVIVQFLRDACQAAGELGGDGAIPALEKLREDESLTVRSAALDALHVLRSREESS